MLKFFGKGAVVVAAIALSTSAFADGAPRGASIKDAPVASAMSWTGFYVGAHLGYSAADLDWGQIYPFGGAGNGPQNINSSFDTDRAVLGGHIGLQRQFGSWVLGGELSLTGGTRDSTINGVNLFGGAQVGTLQAHIGSLFTATARVGYTWDQWLGYVKGGFAGAHVRISADDNVPADFGFNARNFHNGWTLGAGLERMFNNGVILGLEYNYVDLGQNRSDAVVVLDTGIPVGVSASSNVDTSIHSIMARLSIKLGQP